MDWRAQKDRHIMTQKNLSERGELTNWRVQMGRQVKTLEESERVKGTHHLESTDEQTKSSQRCGKNPSKRGALTS